MAVDISIEEFARALFHKMWQKYNLIEEFKENRQLTLLENDEIKRMEDDVFRIVKSKLPWIRQQFQESLVKDGHKYAASVSEFHLYLRGCFARSEFVQLTIFEHLFVTCAFVMELCFHLDVRGRSLIESAHQCWAAYFDSVMKERFYEAGGWQKLKEIARQYKLNRYSEEEASTSEPMESTDDGGAKEEKSTMYTLRALNAPFEQSVVVEDPEESLANFGHVAVVSHKKSGSENFENVIYSFDNRAEFTGDSSRSTSEGILDGDENYKSLDTESVKQADPSKVEDPISEEVGSGATSSQQWPATHKQLNSFLSDLARRWVLFDSPDAATDDRTAADDTTADAGNLPFGPDNDLECLELANLTPEELNCMELYRIFAICNLKKLSLPQRERGKTDPTDPYAKFNWDIDARDIAEIGAQIAKWPLGSNSYWNEADTVLEVDSDVEVARDQDTDSNLEVDLLTFSGMESFFDPLVIKSGRRPIIPVLPLERPTINDEMPVPECRTVEEIMRNSFSNTLQNIHTFVQGVFHSSKED